MTFFLFAGLMLVVALGFVLFPLMRREPTRAAPSTSASNLEAYRVQRREADADHARGLIDQSERDRILDELAGRLAEEVDQDAKPKQERAVSGKNASKRPWILVFVLSVFTLLGPVAAYVMWGAHEARQIDTNAARGAATNLDPDAPLSDKQVLALVENLAKKMEENPSDPKGWILLARSQNALGQWGAAATAFERAVALVPNDAQLLADYADVQAMVQEGSFSGKPMLLIQRALKADPNNLKALALAGTAEMRANNKPQALKHWEKLKTLVPKESDDFTQIAAIITEIKTGKPAFVQNAPPAAPAAAVAAPAAPVARKSVSGEVSGKVSVAPALASKVAKGDTLFVFARAVNGPKMPLAIVRVPVPTQWPFRFSLDDTMAMAPGMNLSAFPQVTVEARISKSGQAQVSAGDLLGQTRALTPPVAQVKVTIDQVAP